MEVKYCGLAEDDDKEQRDQIDNINKNQQLNKKLLDHFRHLAATNQDTDQVTISEKCPYKIKPLLFPLFVFMFVCLFRWTFSFWTGRSQTELIRTPQTDMDRPSCTRSHGKSLLPC